MVLLTGADGARLRAEISRGHAVVVSRPHVRATGANGRIPGLELGQRQERIVACEDAAAGVAGLGLVVACTSGDHTGMRGTRATGGCCRGIRCSGCGCFSGGRGCRSRRQRRRSSLATRKNRRSPRLCSKKPRIMQAGS